MTQDIQKKLTRISVEANVFRKKLLESHEQMRKDNATDRWIRQEAEGFISKLNGEKKFKIGFNHHAVLYHLAEKLTKDIREALPREVAFFISGSDAAAFLQSVEAVLADISAEYDMSRMPAIPETEDALIRMDFETRLDAWCEVQLGLFDRESWTRHRTIVKKMITTLAGALRDMKLILNHIDGTQACFANMRRALFLLRTCMIKLQSMHRVGKIWAARARDRARDPAALERLKAQHVLMLEERISTLTDKIVKLEAAVPLVEGMPAQIMRETVASLIKERAPLQQQLERLMSVDQAA